MSWWRGLVPVRFAPDGEARSRPGVTVAGGPTVQSDTGQQLHPSRAGAARLGLAVSHFCLRGLGGSWHGRAPRREVVLAVDGPAEIKRAARLITSSSARLDRWGSGGGWWRRWRRGWSGRRGAIDKVVFVLLQLKFQQSRVCTGSSSTECWTFQLRTERGTHSTNCAEGCSWRRRPCDQQRQFPKFRGSNPAPDSAHPQSGEHSCCATDFCRDSTGAVLGQGGDMPVVATTGAVLVLVWEVVDMPVYVQRQVPRF